MEDDEIPADELVEALDEIESDFNFLFVGHWLPGGFGEDRKNVGLMIRMFLEAFKNKKNAPGLILKVSHGPASIMDRDEVLKKIDAIRNEVKTTTLPNIYLLHGELEDSQMNFLYNHPKVKAMLSFTKGEGFGRPLIEAAITGKPIIASNWSGHVDFLNTETSVLLPGTLTKVHKSAAWKGVLNEDSEWFSVDLNVAAGFLKDVFKNYKSYTEKSRKTYHHIKTNFSFDAMKDKLGVILDSRIPEFPKMLGLNLPKLKKVESMPQITLPKLKKVDA